MSFKVHEINNYTFEPRSDGPGRLQLWGSSGNLIAEIDFIDDNVPVPAPRLTLSLDSASAYFKRSTLPGLVDLLRKEKCVSVTISSQPPGYVFVHSGLESVGEC